MSGSDSPEKPEAQPPQTARERQLAIEAVRREARRNEALRANLARRKAQARARAHPAAMADPAKPDGD